MDKNLQRYAPPFVADEYSAEDRYLIEPFFSNLDQSVYLAVIPDPELVGALMSGASLLLYTIKKKQTVGNFLFVGILFGLAFQFRYQIAFMLFGACLWALVIERVKILRMSVLMFGFFIISGMGILIDKWGYGEWTFAPYNYFYANLIEKKADLFGVLPWDGYFTLFFLEFYTLPGLFLLSAISIFCFMFYKHFYSWCILPFLLVHFYIGHKETRFLFPMLYISIPILFILFESLFKISNNIFKEILKSLIVALLILNFLFLPYFVFMPPERNMKVIKFINENFPDIKTVFYNRVVAKFDFMLV
jgi:phosphatidylinositol glycan class B